MDVYGYRDAAYLSYALQALGLDTRELGSRPRIFDRADGQVVGRYQLLAGNTLDCFPGRGELKLMQCFYGDVSVFFDKFLPRQFYSDPAIHKMGCDELAQKSRAALSAYLKTSRTTSATNSATSPRNCCCASHGTRCAAPSAIHKD